MEIGSYGNSISTYNSTPAVSAEPAMTEEMMMEEEMADSYPGVYQEGEGGYMMDDGSMDVMA